MTIQGLASIKLRLVVRMAATLGRSYCAPTTRQVPQMQPVPLPSLAALVLGAAATVVQAEEFEFTFWPSKTAATAPRLVLIDAGPCGEIATAKVQRMPRYSKDEPFVPDRAFEVAPNGAVLRTWNVPVGAVPQALQGGALVFSYGQGTFSVTQSGSIAKAKGLSEAQRPQPAKCRLPAELRQSGFAGCWSVMDLAAKKRHVLAYEGVCT